VVVAQNAAGQVSSFSSRAAWTWPSACSHRQPRPSAAAPAYVSASADWPCGDGALAGVALYQALDADLGYAMVLILSGPATAVPLGGRHRPLACGD